MKTLGKIAWNNLVPICIYSGEQNVQIEGVKLDKYYSVKCIEYSRAL